MKIYGHVYAVLGLGVVLAAVSVANPPARQATKAPQQVTVTNSPAQAVPVSVQGTPNVNVSGTVSVGNPGGSPVPVRDVDVEARIPVTISGTASMNNGQYSAGGTVFYTVPAGKRLVAQSVVANCAFMPIGQRLVDARVGALLDISYSIAMQYTGTDGDDQEQFSGQLTGPLFFTEGKQIRMIAGRNADTGFASASVIINGYLEEM